MRYVTSQDGTKIAYDRSGDGPPVVLIAGLFCDRLTTGALADQLARHFTVINYDRRGRGDSTDTAPYSVRREVEDLSALIAEVGGSAAIYGHSSGAGLALQAAARGLPITRLVLHEPPYVDEDGRPAQHDLAEAVRTAIAEDRRTDAITLFLTASGMPADMAAGMAADPRMQAVAPTMPYDFAVMGDGTIPEDTVRSLAMPTLVLAGSASPRFFLDTATRLAQLLPQATHTVLEGQDHGAPAEVVAPVVAAFLRDGVP